MTGYEAYKYFQTSVGYVWHAPDSQIYPELRRMEADGLLESKETPMGKKGKRKTYYITDAGREDFRRWVNEPAEYVRERDPVHLRAAYFEWAEPDNIRQHLLTHIEYHESRISQWQDLVVEIVNRSNPTLIQRLESYPEDQWQKIIDYKIFAYEGMIARSRAEVAWAQKGLDTLHGLADSMEHMDGDFSPGVRT